MATEQKNKILRKRGLRSNVRKPNKVVFNLFYGVFRAYYFLCGVRIKAVNEAGKPELPAIVLCNHGSFIDFVYAATLTRQYRPNFVVARLYFYDKLLGRLIRTVGGFPKSMFALDLESTKNCVRVLRNNGLLIMMPEARLSTTGRFEDIQKSTFSFLKKSGVPIYTIQFHGDYLADPKWGKGFRRGSVVEAKMELLFTAQELTRLTVDEIQKGVEARLDYDEFAWLRERPQQRYRARHMAEGLENILAFCPVCGQKHTLTTKKDKIFCQKCGYLTSVDDRYRFTGDFRFDNLAQWYDWQKALLEKEIRADKEFALRAQVELRLPSKGVGLTRSAGQGVCTLSRDGLLYCGTKDGQTVQLHFSLERVYRLLFGAGKNFEIYDGSQILFFVPEDKRSCVDWYMVSMILYDETVASAEC